MDEIDRNEFNCAVYELCDSIKDVLGTLNFYIGPGARTAVSPESVKRYLRVSSALKKVKSFDINETAVDG